jgi:hypothetical protein
MTGLVIAGFMFRPWAETKLLTQDQDSSMGLDWSESQMSAG